MSVSVSECISMNVCVSVNLSICVSTHVQLGIVTHACMCGIQTSVLGALLTTLVLFVKIR